MPEILVKIYTKAHCGIALLKYKYISDTSEGKYRHEHTHTFK